MKKSTWTLTVSLLAMLASACGDDDETCTVGTAEGCDDGLVCEATVDGEPICATPVVVQGRVFDALSDVGIGGARIVARDANGVARSSVSESAEDGTYELPVPLIRNAEGDIVDDGDVTLRVDAAGYQPFPKAPRQALPLDLDNPDSRMEVDGKLVVMNAATDVALIPRETLADGSIRGRIDHEAAAGALVVAQQGDAAVSTAIADRDGEFVLFDVPAGETVVAGFIQGLNITPETVTVANEEVADVVLAAGTDGLATVSGNVNIVNAPGGVTTSVILVLESTFDAAVVRGEAPPGLRAAPVDGAFEIAGVPPGSYAVLAAFENDQLVRDPDEGIGGTEVVFVDVAGSDVVLEQSFKVTEALNIVGPGADGLETVTSVPELVWADDSSEEGYEVRIYDAYGDVVFENLDVPSVSGSGNVTATWTDAAPVAGMVYQFRAWSFRVDSTGNRNYISATEDLKGVFLYQP